MKVGELSIIRNHLMDMAALNHHCRLKKLHPEDVARGLRIGQPCDDCVAYVNDRMKQIIDECDEFNKKMPQK